MKDLFRETWCKGDAVFQGKSDTSQDSTCHFLLWDLGVIVPRSLGVRESPDSQTKRERERPRSYNGEELDSTNSEWTDKWILSRISLSIKPQSVSKLISTLYNPEPLWTSDLWCYKVTYVCCFELLILWQLVMAAIECNSSPWLEMCTPRLYFLILIPMTPHLYLHLLCSSEFHKYICNLYSDVLQTPQTHWVLK